MTRLIQYKRTMPADLETPVGIYLKIRDLYPQSALLESSDYHTRHNAESFVGVNPIGGFKVVGDRIIIERPGEVPVEKPIAKGVDVVDELTAFMRGFEIVGADPSLPDGLLGYTAYDAVRYFEEGVDISRPEAKFAEIPDINYILYRYIIVINHYKNEMTVVENCPEGSAESIDSVIGVLGGNVAQYPFAALDDKESSMTDADFIKAVERCTEASNRGDVFQIVPSRRFLQGFRGDEFNVYRALRCINPSPYLFYFDFGTFKVFGSSPETHLRITGHTAYIDPIAGTFRRTGDDAEDRRLAEALLADEKENAEHIMLVDLNSRFESSPGIKSPELIASFITNLKTLTRI